MLKYVMLATAMTVAVPALAQTAPQTAQPAPMTATPAVDPAMESPVAAAPADPAAQPAGDQAEDQVASIVDAEFASYDKDASGSLSKAEFATWMDALKAKAPDATATAAKPDPKWNEAAFKQADSDKSKSVTKEELAGFLSSGTKSAS